MRIITYGAQRGMDVTTFGSTGVRFSPLTRVDGGGVGVMRVAAGGEIGRHPTAMDQLFVVVAGKGSVCGGDGVWQPIEAGQAALWSAGEEHTTRAEEPLVAVVIEASQVPAPTPPG
jgi:mannose-6-phosphate isomerase-like protein (cupin superfamily)